MFPKNIDCDNFMFCGSKLNKRNVFSRKFSPHPCILFSQSLCLDSSRYLTKFKTAAAAARVEAERSCAVRHSHLHHQSHHATAGNSTGLSWLGTSAPKASVFASVPGSSNSASQSNQWNMEPEKSPTETPNRFQLSGSPVKLESGNARSNPDHVSTSLDCSDNVNTSNGSSGSSIATGSAAASASVENGSQNSFRGYSTPPKEERENGAVPLTPSSGASTSTSGHQHHPSIGDCQGSSEQQPPSTPIDRCPLPQQPLPNNQLYHQSSLDMKQETSLLPSSTSAILPYSHAYMAASVGGYGGPLSSYPPTHENKASITLYPSKSKSKNRSSTGKVVKIFTKLFVIWFLYLLVQNVFSSLLAAGGVGRGQRALGISLFLSNPNLKFTLKFKHSFKLSQCL